MITPLYAGVLTLFIVWLSLNVVKIRKAKRIRYGDGGDLQLQLAIRAQGNAVEYIPLAIIMLGLLEWSGAHWTLIHLSGISLLIGRLLHARGFLTERHRPRVLGMKFTLFTLIGLAVLNIFYTIQSFIFS